MSKRIETKVSITAQGVCLIRAISYFEQNPNYHCDDWVAAQFIWPIFRLMAKYRFSRDYLKKRFLKTPGMYEYIIGRTKVIDEVFTNYAAKIEQMVIFGAGFDSRAIRFKNELTKTPVFELDAPITQQEKIKRLKARNITLPANLKFVAIDFTKESLYQKLAEAGFAANRRTLFLLEGLTYYLDQASIDTTFKLIGETGAPGSVVVFDFTSVDDFLREKAQLEPQMKKHKEFLAKMGEKPGFAFTGPISVFLERFGFTITKELDAAVRAEKFFAGQTREVTTRILRIVTATKL